MIKLTICEQEKQAVTKLVNKKRITKLAKRIIVTGSKITVSMPTGTKTRGKQSKSILTTVSH